MSIKKIVGLAVLLIVVVVAGIFIYLSMNYSSIVKAGVETHGPKFTKTSVSMDGVKVSPFAGEVELLEFLIGNPEGYKTTHAFKVDSVSVAVDLGSITSDVIRIKEIVVDSPDVIYELGGAAGSNLQAIQKNIEAASGAGKGKAEPAPAASGGEGPRVVIDNLYIRKPKVALSAGVLKGKTVEVPVPDLHLKDIGKQGQGGGQGVTMAEASAKVMDELLASVSKAAKSINLDAIKNQVDGLAKEAEGMSKGVGGAAGDIGKGVSEGLKGVLGK
ncbi:MAG TPA: hypothetical protein VLN73_02650 [Alphaproteobacteria bacterium]|nr:hypothetical protein [Alphaproteobacteria bacterium]